MSLMKNLAILAGGALIAAAVCSGFGLLALPFIAPIAAGIGLSAPLTTGLLGGAVIGSGVAMEGAEGHLNFRRNLLIAKAGNPTHVAKVADSKVEAATKAL